jgi:hypothetical protein
MTGRVIKPGARRVAALCLGAGLATGGLSGCGGGTKPPNIAAIDVTPAAVHTVTFTAQNRTATITQDDGLWTPGAGATVQAATMLTTTADRLFPLNAYRIMANVNNSDPAYGLTALNAVPDCGPVCSVSASDNKGHTWKLTVGKPSFNGAGFYARVDGDPKLYLITQTAVADIISEAIGQDFQFPESEKYKKVDAALNAVGADDEQTDYDPYLVQVLAAQKMNKPQPDGRTPQQVLLDAAASTKNQAGAKNQKQVTTVPGPNTGATPQEYGQDQRGVKK